MFQILRDILTGFWSLIVGLGVTGKTGVEPAVTEQYPNELFDRPLKRHGVPHRQVAPGFRGLLAVTWDWEHEVTTCIACQACARVCPSRCIDNIEAEGKGRARRAKSFRVDLLRCCYCGLCEEVCPVPDRAIFLTRDYEDVVYDRQELVGDLDSLTRRAQKHRPRPDGIVVKPWPPEEATPRKATPSEAEAPGQSEQEPAEAEEG